MLVIAHRYGIAWVVIRVSSIARHPAHVRIQTIADADRIIVLEDGAVIEQGVPWTLMNTRGGAFAEMVNNTGEADVRNIRDMARKAAIRRQARNDSAEHASL